MVPKSCTSWGDGPHWYHFLIQDTLKKQVVSSPDESTLNSFSVQLPGQQSLRWVLITPLPRRSSTRLGEADVWWLNSVILTSMRMLKSYKHDWLVEDGKDCIITTTSISFNCFCCCDFSNPYVAKQRQITHGQQGVILFLHIWSFRGTSPPLDFPAAWLPKRSSWKVRNCFQTTFFVYHEGEWQSGMHSSPPLCTRNSWTSGVFTECHNFKLCAGSY